MTLNTDEHTTLGFGLLVWPKRIGSRVKLLLEGEKLKSARIIYEKEIVEWTKKWNAGELEECPKCGNEKGFMVKRYTLLREDWEGINDGCGSFLKEFEGEVDTITCGECYIVIVDNDVSPPQK